jgi:hypothetical protein
MNRITKLICAAVLLVLSTQAQADNRDEENSIFPPKTDSTIVEQAVIGFGEYVLFNTLHVKEHGLTPLKGQLDDYDQKKMTEITEALKSPDLLDIERTKLNKEYIKHEDSLIQRKLRVVANAEAAAARSHFVQKVLYAGQALIVVDMFSRVYVWQKLDRDPTISPAATFVLKKIEGK